MDNKYSKHSKKKDCNVTGSRSAMSDRTQPPPRPSSQPQWPPGAAPRSPTAPPQQALYPTLSDQPEASSRPLSMARDLEESLLQCPICMEPFTTPKSLKCQHVFCLPCLEQILDTAAKTSPRTPDTFNCPTCRMTNRVPKGGLAKLPASHLVNSLVDLTKKHKGKKQVDTQSACTICKAEGKHQEASRYCFTCPRQMCTSCTGKHNRTSSFTNHVSVDITTGGIQSVVCTDHKEEYISCFCVVCNVPVCDVCLLIKHREHKHVGFINTTSKTQSLAADTAQKYQAAEQMLTSQLAKYTAVKTSIQKEKQSFKDNVQRHLDHQIELLKAEQQQLLKESDSFFFDVEQTISVKEYHMLDVLDKIKDRERQIDNQKNPIQGLKELSLDVLDPQGDETIHEAEGLCSKTSMAVNYKFQAGSRVQLGTAESQCLLLDADVKAVKSVNVEQTNDDSVKWTVTSCPHVMGLCVFENTSDIVSVSNVWPKMKLASHDKYGQTKPLPSYLKKNEQGLYRVNINDNYTVILQKSETDSFSVVVYKKEKLVRSFPYRGEGEPRAMSVRSNGEVIIASINPQWLSCFSAKGDIQWQHRKQLPENLGHFKFPIKIMNNKFNQIFVVDIDGHQLHVYDTRGDYLYSFPSKVDPTLKPVSACFYGDMIIVAFRKPLCTISKFDFQGNLIKNLIKLSFEPTKIQCLENERLLLVGSWGMGFTAYDLKKLE